MVYADKPAVAVQLKISIGLEVSEIYIMHNSGLRKDIRKTYFIFYYITPAYTVH